MIELINLVASSPQFEDKIKNISFNKEMKNDDNALHINSKIALKIFGRNKSKFAKKLTPEQFEESPLAETIRMGSPFIKGQKDQIKNTFAEKLKTIYDKFFQKK
jgi:hypothetical protein